MEEAEEAFSFPTDWFFRPLVYKSKQERSLGERSLGDAPRSSRSAKKAMRGPQLVRAKNEKSENTWWHDERRRVLSELSEPSERALRKAALDYYWEEFHWDYGWGISGITAGKNILWGYFWDDGPNDELNHDNLCGVSCSLQRSATGLVRSRLHWYAEPGSIDRFPRTLPYNMKQRKCSMKLAARHVHGGQIRWKVASKPRGGRRKPGEDFLMLQDKQRRGNKKAGCHDLLFRCLHTLQIRRVASRELSQPPMECDLEGVASQRDASESVEESCHAEPARRGYNMDDFQDELRTLFTACTEVMALTRRYLDNYLDTCESESRDDRKYQELVVLAAQCWIEQFLGELPRAEPRGASGQDLSQGLEGQPSLFSRSGLSGSLLQKNHLLESGQSGQAPCRQRQELDKLWELCEVQLLKCPSKARLGRNQRRKAMLICDNARGSYSFLQAEFQALKDAESEHRSMKQSLKKLLQSSDRPKSSTQQQLEVLTAELHGQCAEHFRQCPVFTSSHPHFLEVDVSVEIAFETLREVFLRFYGGTIKHKLSQLFPWRDVVLDPNPLDVGVKFKFLKAWTMSEGPSKTICPAFHGTRESVLPSIFRRGFLIPGLGNNLRVRNGSTHGFGIYMAKLGAAHLSYHFAGYGGDGLLVGCVLDDATPTGNHYCLGRRVVTAESETVRHVGDAIVVFDQSCVAPFFQVRTHRQRWW